MNRYNHANQSDTSDMSVTDADRERQISALWLALSIPKKQHDLHKDAQEFVFFDVPPFSNGSPHHGAIGTGVLFKFRS